jgi:tight adherence protein B
MRRALGAAALAVLLLPAAAGAGVTIGSPDTNDYPTLHLTTVTTDPVEKPPRLRENGRLVTDLAAKNLGGPKAIAIAVDRSKSMTGKPLADAVAAAKVLLRTKRPDDQVALFAFSSGAQELTDFSNDPAEVTAALDALTADGQEGTALYDTVVQAADGVAKNELLGRVLVLITDGRDVSEKGSLAAAIAAARDVGVAVYPIGIAAGSHFSPVALRRLAYETGGEYSEASSSAALVKLSHDLVNRLGRTWELTYPTAARPGGRVRLDVSQPGAGHAERTIVIPRDAGKPPTESPVSTFLFHSAAGNLLAALLLGLLILLVTTHALGARNIRRVRRRLEPHVPITVAEPSAEKQQPVQRRFAFLNGLFSATERAFSRFPAWNRLRKALERADAPIRPAEFFYTMVGAGLLVAFFVTVVGLPFLVALIGFLLGGALPYVILARKGGQRQKAFDEQLPDLLMTMGASLRAGHNFRQSMQAVVEESADPASKEFKHVLLETGFGRPIDQALVDVAKRLGSRNFDYVISVVSIQREVGGSLANLFDMVSETVRHRQQFGKKVRALTAMGRTSAYVLVGMPFFLVVVLSLINYRYMAPLFTTHTGRFLMVIAVIGMAIGGLILKKIVSFRMA